MITAALADLLPGTLVLADCDVDAANLALLLNPELICTEPIYGDEIRSNRSRVCTACGACVDGTRRFDSVYAEGDAYQGESNPL